MRYLRSNTQSSRVSLVGIITITLLLSGHILSIRDVCDDTTGIAAWWCLIHIFAASLGSAGADELDALPLELVVVGDLLTRLDSEEKKNERE